MTKKIFARIYLLCFSFFTSLLLFLGENSFELQGLSPIMQKVQTYFMQRSVSRTSLYNNGVLFTSKNGVIKTNVVYKQYYLKMPNIVVTSFLFDWIRQIQLGWSWIALIWWMSENPSKLENQSEIFLVIIISR